MTQRDQKMVVVLGSVVAGLGVAAFLFYQWFWVPLKSYNANLDRLADENSVLEREWNDFMRGLKKLELAKLRSLPNKVDQATNEYNSYLESAFKSAGLQLTKLAPGNVAKVKPPASVPEIKEVNHRTMPFAIEAFGEEGALVALMENLRRTPYEHRIRSMAIERTDKTYDRTASKKLKISMTIEVLLVADNPNTMGLHPGVDPSAYLYNHIAARNGGAPAGWGIWASTIAVALSKRPEFNRAELGPLVSASQLEPRDYVDIAKRNIFVGAIAPTRSYDENTDPAKTPPPEFVPQYVRLSTVLQTTQEAYFRNLIYDKREQKLMAKRGSGYDTFRITDERERYTFLLGKLLLVDSRDIYFQVRDQVFQMHVGESLAKAMEHPVSVEFLFESGLNELFDKEWAKDPSGGDPKKKFDPRKKGTKGR